MRLVAIAALALVACGSLDNDASSARGFAALSATPASATPRATIEPRPTQPRISATNAPPTPAVTAAPTSAALQRTPAPSAAAIAAEAVVTPTPVPARTIAPGGDNVRPTVTTLAASTAVVAPGADVSVTMQVEDDGGAGIEHVLMNYVLPDGDLAFGSALELRLVSGDRWRGTWSATFKVSAAAAAGTWKIHDVVVIDAAGNRRVYLGDDPLLAALTLAVAK